MDSISSSELPAPSASTVPKLTAVQAGYSAALISFKFGSQMVERVAAGLARNQTVRMGHCFVLQMLVS